MSRICDQFELNCDPKMMPTIKETTTATRVAVRVLTPLPISMTSPCTRTLEPSAPLGRVRIANTAAMKLTNAMSTAYATHKPIFTPNWVQMTRWKPSWSNHMTSVMNRDSPKNRPMITTSTATMVNPTALPA